METVLWDVGCALAMHRQQLEFWTLLANLPPFIGALQRTTALHHRLFSRGDVFELSGTLDDLISEDLLTQGEW